MLVMTAVGRIGRDAELRNTPGGDSVCNVAIGCNFGRRDENKTQWVEGALWGARADALAEHLTKGKQVILVLKDVHVETYQGSNGPGSKLVGTIQELEFGASPQGDQGGQGGQDTRQQSGGAPQRQPTQGRGQGQQAPARGQQRGNGHSAGGRDQQSNRNAQQRGGDSGFDDMSDDIPF